MLKSNASTMGASDHSHIMVACTQLQSCMTHATESFTLLVHVHERLV